MTDRFVNHLRSNEKISLAIIDQIGGMYKKKKKQNRGPIGQRSTGGRQVTS